MHPVQELLGGFEVWGVVCGDDEGGVGTDVACGFLGTVLEDEAAKSTEVHLFPALQGGLHGVHERFHDGEHCRAVDAGPFRYLSGQFCLGHSFVYLIKLLISSNP